MIHPYRLPFTAIVTLCWSLLSAPAFASDIQQDSARQWWNALQQAAFVENRGQWGDEAKFLLSMPGFHIWLTDSGMVLDQFRIDSSAASPLRRGHVIRILFPVSSKPHWRAVETLSGFYHFFRNGQAWRFVRRYRRIFADYGDFTLEYLIDTVHKTLRYNLHFPQGRTLSSFQIRIVGIDSLWIDEAHRLVCRTSVGTITQLPPVAFVHQDSIRAVECAFHRSAPGAYTFRIAPLLPQSRLTIDPLVFSSYIGGANSDEVWGVAIDKNGNIYLTGRTVSASFPVTAGAYQTNKNGQYDAFVVKLNPSASSLIYATFLGGSADDYGNDIATDLAGNAYVTGVTWSSDFPVASGYSTTFAGQRDVFVSKLSPNGASLVYSTFIGGVSWDDPSKIVLNSAGEAIVCGQTVSSNFPVTPNALSMVLNGNPSINTWDGFVFKLSANGQQLLYSSFIGGRSLDAASGVAVDAQGNIYVTGRTISPNFPVTAAAYDTTLNAGDSSAFDAFVLKINGSSSNLAWSTFLGGTSHDKGTAITVLSNGNVAVSGITQSSNFPASNTYGGGEDGFVALFNSSGSSLLAARFIGGSSTDRALDIAADNSGIYLCGNTESGDFPTTSNAYDQSNNGARDAFGAKWNLSLSTLLYSSYLGGSENEEGLSLAVDDNGQMVIGGYTLSDNFPTTRGVFDSTFGGSSGDGFVAMLGTLPPHITLLNPEGGESWCVGSEVSIRWQSRSVQEVKILLSSDGGNTFPTVLAQHIPAAYGMWVWTIDPSLSPGTTYRIRIQDQNSATVVDESENFTIKAPPQILQHPDSVEVCVGDTAVFIVHALGFPTPVAEWQVSTDGGSTWQNLNVSGDTLRIAPVPATADGNLYRAVFYNVCSEGVASNAALLTVVLPPQILQQPQSQTVCIGDTLILEVLTDQQDVQYQWQKDGQNLPGYTQRRLVLPDVTANMAGNYTVVITGRCPPPVVSAVAHIAVQDVPELAEPPSFRPLECTDQTLDTVIRLSNAGPLDVTVELLTVDNPDFQFPGSFPVPIAANTTVAIPVRFTPSRAGVSVATALFRMHPCEVDFEVTMGVRVDSIHLQTAPLDFGLLYQCDTFALRSIAVQNTGTLALRIDSVTFSHPQFKLVGTTFPIEIAPEEEYRFSIQFTRSGSATGLINAEATLFTNRCNYTATIPLRATQDSLFFTLSRETVTFDTLRDCNTVSTKKIFLYNPTDRPIRIIKALSNHPAFSVVDPPLPFVLSPKAPTWITIQFAAGNNGWNVGTIELIAEQCDVQQTLEVRGFQILPSLTLASAVQFPLLPECTTPFDTVVRIYNPSSDVIRIDSIQIGPPFSVLGSLQGVTIAPGDSLPITIRFDPLATGTYTDTLRVFFTSTQCSGIRSSVLFAQQVRPSLLSTATPPLVLAADTCARSAQQMVTLINPSPIPITIQSAQFQTGAFQLLSAPPPSIPAGDSIVLPIRFTAPAAGTFFDTLDVRYQPCDKRFLLPVIGTKVGVSIAVLNLPSSDTADVGTSTLCDTTHPLTLSSQLGLTASGSENIDSVTIAAVSATAPFQLTGIAPGMRIAAQDTLFFTVSIASATAGTFVGMATLIIDPCAQVIQIPLRAQFQTLAVDAPPDRFLGTTTIGQTLSDQLVWRNLSAEPILIDSVWVDNARFTLSLLHPADLPAILGTQDSIVLQIRFTPLQEGKDTATIFVHVAQPCGTVSSVQVWGEGVTTPRPTLAVQDTLLDFGTVLVGQQRTRSLTVENLGPGTATVDSILLLGTHPADFSVTTTTPLTIDAGTLRNIDIVFQPTAVGTRSAQLHLYTNAGNFMVHLRGKGISENLQATVYLPDRTARPGDFVDIPIILRSDQPFALLSTVDSCDLTLRFKAALLYIHQIDGARLTHDTITGKWRIVQIRGPVQDTILATLHAEVLLGDTIATPLLIDSIRWTPPVIVTTKRHGLLRLATDELVHLGGAFGIVRITPHPLTGNGWILIHTPLVVPHTLSLYDLSGRIVWSLSFTPTVEQTQQGIQIPFSVGNLAPGTYVLKLTAPERQASYPVFIIR